MKPPFVTEPLGKHDRAAFFSGSDALDRYLRERASQDVRRRVAGCFVALDAEGQIAGFYTLAASSIELHALPDGMAKGLPRYPVVPAMLIGRRAVASRYQGKGLGGALMPMPLSEPISWVSERLPWWSTPRIRGRRHLRNQSFRHATPRAAAALRRNGDRTARAACRESVATSGRRRDLSSNSMMQRLQRKM